MNELNKKKREMIDPNRHIHEAMGHAWHDPDCECCKRARLTCKRHRRKDLVNMSVTMLRRGIY